MRSIARSRRVANDFLAKTWFNEWAANPGNNIIVAQTTRGIVDHAEYFLPQAA